MLENMRKRFGLGGRGRKTSVKQVFSVLERICKATGENLKEDMCEIRTLLQVNGDLDEMHNRLVVKWGQ